MNSTHPFVVKGEIEQVPVRLRSAVAFPSFRHDSGHLGGRQLEGSWLGLGAPAVLDSFISIG